MKENKLVDLSMEFAVEILKICEGIKGHYSMVNQVERSATSIGANIREAKYAYGRADFIAKRQYELASIAVPDLCALRAQFTIQIRAHPKAERFNSVGA